MNIGKWPWWNIINSAIAATALVIAGFQAYSSYLFMRKASLHLYIEKSKTVANTWNLTIKNDGPALAKDIYLRLKNDKENYPKFVERLASQANNPISALPPAGYFTFYDVDFRPNGYTRVEFVLEWKDSDKRSTLQTVSF